MQIVILPKFRPSQVDLWQAVFSVYVLPAKMHESTVTLIFASLFLAKTAFVIAFLTSDTTHVLIPSTHNKNLTFSRDALIKTMAPEGTDAS